MPYILLIIGVLLGLYGLIRFADKASAAQMKKLMEALFALVLAIILLYLIVTEKLGLIVLWLIFALPFFLMIWRRRKLKETTEKTGKQKSND